MTLRKKVFSTLAALIIFACSPSTEVPVKTSTSITPSVTAKVTNTAESTNTSTLTPTHVHITETSTESPTETQVSEITATSEFTSTPGTLTQPFPNAPLCEEHSTNEFHTLWNYELGCHYDHEHGTDPFTPAVDQTFPSFDLKELLGDVEIGHTNPSSSMENSHKHGGFKWDVVLSPTHGCVGGFENATYCVPAAVIQYHNFGDYAMEMEARIHSSSALVKMCNPSSSSDCGYLYTVQFMEFGQRVSPYQGTIVPYLDNPVPAYARNFGPYFTIDCVYTGLPGCRESIDFIKSRGLSANSIWTSKPTGSGVRPLNSTLLRILFRIRDNYQVLDSRDLTYPFTFAWICSSDNGVTYNAAGCRYNNTTSKVHEVGGTIPATWDNLIGFDTNPTVGRITAEGFTSKFGTLNQTCSEPSADCFPVKMVNAFVGSYGDYLTAAKVSNTTPISNPERDVYFCNGVVCTESSTGAQPSGWIEREN